MIIEVIFGFLLLVIAVIDYFYQEVPSVFTTTLTLGALMLNQSHLFFGVAAGLFGLLLFEMDFTGKQYLGGVADIKVLAMIGLFVSSMMSLAVLMVATVSVGLCAAVYRTVRYRRGRMPDTFPFLPALFVVYVIVQIVEVYYGA